MNAARQRTLIVAGVVLVALALIVAWGIGAGANRPSAVGTPTIGSATTSAARPTKPASGLARCTEVPHEVTDAVGLVRANGPYLRPRDDGGTFGNRERLLPAKPNGYYREYTVRAPGQRFPGPRRLITGGQSKPGAEPAIWFYTADHYESFCELLP